MLDVIYEDNHILVVIKPQNVPTQEDESKDEDMLSMCKAYLKEKYNKPGNVYCGLVHRLDRPTGGVMVFAKTSKAASRLCAEIGTENFEKEYLAVLVGTPRIPQDFLTHYLLKDEARNVVEVVPSSTTGAKRAELKYQVLASNSQVSLVKVNLFTGRSHQIRVQLATIGNPVFGDVKYKGDSIAKGWNLALWAYKLNFVHPVSGKTMNFTVYPPLEDTPWNMFDFKTILG